MPDPIQSAVVWAIFFVVALMMCKRLGYSFGPGPLNVVGMIILLAVFSYFFLLYWSVVESPNERKLRELQMAGDRTS